MGMGKQRTMPGSIDYTERAVQFSVWENGTKTVTTKFQLQCGSS